MAESRLQRWARKKAEASKAAEAAPSSATDESATSAPAATGDSGLSPTERELATNEALPEHEVLAKYNLPDPDSIGLGTDITGFMRKEIPELLRRRALRALWKSNPVLAVLDGLNDYDEDFSNAATTVSGLQTLYKVGQGMFDKNARREERQADEERDKKVAEQAQNQPRAESVADGAPEKVAESVTGQAPEQEIEITKLEIAAEPSHNEYTQTGVADAEAEPEPRYRPRMRFE